MENNKPFLSVIVLCYKVEKWLPQCLESLRRQTFKDFEVIMVNDGSPDACGEICNAYTRLDPRFKVIHKENGGIIAARKDALNMAKGLYAGSVDGDDWVSLNMYEKMCTAAMEYRADIVQTDFLIHLTDHSERGSSVKETKCYSREEVKQNTLRCISQGGQFLEVSLCRSIIRTDRLREIMNELDDRSGLCEDAVCMFVYARDINCLYHISDPLYHYRIRANSCTTSLTSRNPDGLYRLFQYAERQLRGDDFGDLLLQQLAYYFLNHCLITILKTLKQLAENEYHTYLKTTIENPGFQVILSHVNRPFLESQLYPEMISLLRDKTTTREFVEGISFYSNKTDIFQ